MKSYQRALLSATLLALAAQGTVNAGAKKKKETHEPDKKPVNRDWLCDTGKKNVGKITCATCHHPFVGLKRRKHCAHCNPKVVQKRLADDEIRYNNPEPRPEAEAPRDRETWR